MDLRQNFLYLFAHLDSKNIQYIVFKHIREKKKNPTGLNLGVNLDLNSSFPFTHFD